MTEKPKKITYLGSDGKTMEFSSYDELEAHLRKHPGTDALLTTIKEIQSKKNVSKSIENITDTKTVAYTDTNRVTYHFKSFEEMRQWMAEQPEGDEKLKRLKKATRLMELEKKYDVFFGKNPKINQALNAIKQRLSLSKTLTKEQIENMCASNGLSIIETSMALTILRNQSDIETKREGLLGFLGIGTEVFSLKR